MMVLGDVMSMRAGLDARWGRELTEVGKSRTAGWVDGGSDRSSAELASSFAWANSGELDHRRIVCWTLNRLTNPSRVTLIQDEKTRLLGRNGGTLARASLIKHDTARNTAREPCGTVNQPA
jgi:hypothetical protein